MLLNWMIFIAYENALNELSSIDQEAVILRIEFGLSYAEIAEAMEKPSADASRMQVKRALVKLAESMNIPHQYEG